MHFPELCGLLLLVVAALMRQKLKDFANILDLRELSELARGLIMPLPLHPAELASQQQMIH